MEITDDGKYLETRLGSISFNTIVGEVLDLHYVLYISSTTKILFSISCLTNLRCGVEFDDQEVIIRSSNLYPR